MRLPGGGYRNSPPLPLHITRRQKNIQKIGAIALHPPNMIDLLELLRTVLIAAGRQKPKGGTAEYADEQLREEEDRQKVVADMMARYEAKRAAIDKDV